MIRRDFLRSLVTLAAPEIALANPRRVYSFLQANPLAREDFRVLDLSVRGSHDGRSWAMPSDQNRVLVFAPFWEALMRRPVVQIEDDGYLFGPPPFDS